MTDNLILILSIVFSGILGAFLGVIFMKLKAKSEKSTLEERQNQMSSTINELKASILNLESERDKFRDEREGLNIELTQRNTEFENL